MANELSFGKKLRWAALATAAMAGPFVPGFLNAPQIRAQSAPTTGASLPSFEVAAIKPNHSGESNSGTSIRPGRFKATNQPTQTLIKFAYNVQDFQL